MNNKYKDTTIGLVVLFFLVLWAFALALIVITDSVIIRVDVEPIHSTVEPVVLTPVLTPLTPTPMETKAEEVTLLVPTDIPVVKTTPTLAPPCYFSEYVDVWNPPMNTRIEPHEASDLFDVIYDPVRTRVLWSEKHPDWCWLRLGEEYNNAWLALTDRVRYPVVRKSF